DCGGSITVAQHQWWDSICDCGVSWGLSIKVTAEKEIKKKGI
ncbi:hypothetical protein LCGC14_2656220, partial [marine sediment metagenome]